MKLLLRGHHWCCFDFHKDSYPLILHVRSCELYGKEDNSIVCVLTTSCADNSTNLALSLLLDSMFVKTTSSVLFLVSAVIFFADLERVADGGLLTVGLGATPRLATVIGFLPSSCLDSALGSGVIAMNACFLRLANLLRGGSALISI